jgi:hypothetical protein
MAVVITAPERIKLPGPKVFLGGAIDMGKAVNWQAHVIESLSDQADLILLNPRRKEFTDDTLDEQIQWELKALEMSDIVIIWFPTSSKAPISFLEAGIYMKSGRLVIGVEEGFYRQRNLELTCEHYKVPLFRDLGDIVDEVVRRYTLAMG